MHQDKPSAQEASSLHRPRERASGEVSISDAPIAQSLAAIVESQARLNTQTAQMLQTLLAGGAAPAELPAQQAAVHHSVEPVPAPNSPSTGAQQHSESMQSQPASDAMNSVAEAQSRLERERQQLELDRLELSVDLASHRDRLKQLERSFEEQLNIALKQAVEELRAEFRVPFDQMQLLLHLIHEAERSLSRLAAQSAISNPATADRRESGIGNRESATGDPRAGGDQSAIGRGSERESESRVPNVESQVPEADRGQSSTVESAERAPTVLDSPAPNSTATLDDQTNASGGSVAPTASPQADQDKESEHEGRSHRRQSNRLKVESLECNLGRIMDISRGGVRLLCLHPPEGDDLRLEICHDAVTFEAPVEVVWTNRLGWRTYQVGLRFKELSEQNIAALTRISMDNRIRRTIGLDGPNR